MNILVLLLVRPLKPRTRLRMIGIIERNRWSDAKIARHFGVDSSSVSKLRNARGLPTVAYSTCTPLTVARILRLHAAGHNKKQIVRATGVKISIISRILREKGTLLQPEKTLRKVNLSRYPALLIELIRANRWSDARLTKRFGISGKAIGKIRTSLGLNKIQFPHYTPAKIKGILQMHREGKSVEEIAKLVNRSANSVNDIINYFVRKKPKK